MPSDGLLASARAGALERELLGPPRPEFLEETPMLSWTIMFLVLALIAGFLGMGGVAAVSADIAWILFVLFLALFVVSLFLGRRPRPLP